MKLSWYEKDGKAFREKDKIALKPNKYNTIYTYYTYTLNKYY